MIASTSHDGPSHGRHTLTSWKDSPLRYLDPLPASQPPHKIIYRYKVDSTILSLQCKHVHGKYLSWKPLLLLLMQNFQPPVVEQAPEVPERSGHAAVLAIHLKRSLLLPYNVVLDDHEAALLQRRAAAVDQLQEVHVGEVPHHPLDPEKVVAVFRGGKILQGRSSEWGQCA